VTGLGTMAQERAHEHVEQWRKWYWEGFHLILESITDDVTGMAKGLFQNQQRIEPWELARLERVIAALHLCCKAMPAIDDSGQCGREREVDLLTQMAANLHSYAEASKQVYPTEEPPF
jgi:hypothetical protein